MDFSLIQSTPQTAQPPGAMQPPTRNEKTTEFVSNVLPSAVFTGLQAFGSGSSASAGVSAAGATARAASVTGTMGSAASIVGGLWGGAQLAMNWGKSSPSAGASSGAALGGAIGTMICPGVGTLIGAGVGAIAGGLIGSITSGKHKDQKVRDAVREQLINMGVLNQDYQLQLANGSTYDMGRDGGPRAEFGNRRPYEIDTSNPLVHYAVNWMDPVIALLAPGNTKIRNDFAGYFANAAVTNARDLNDVQRNVELFMAKFGLSNETLAKGVVSLAQSGYISEQMAQGWIAGIQQRMSNTAVSETTSPQHVAPPISSDE